MAKANSIRSDLSCDRAARGRGMCMMHYQRAKKAGELQPLPPYPTACSSAGCPRAVTALGLCGTHYARLKKTGTIDLATKKSDAERFEAYVLGGEGCWGWAGYFDGSGYGIFWGTGRGVEKRNHHAHRVAFMLAGGTIPDGAWVDHICRNRACVRPDHLRIASPKQNAENRSPIGKGASGYRGVFRAEEGLPWYVQVKHFGKVHYGGKFADVEEAARAATELRNSLFTYNIEDRR